MRILAAYGDARLPPAAETVLLVVAGARDLAAADKGGTSDPFCVLQVEGKKFKKKIKTGVVKKVFYFISYLFCFIS